MNGYVISGPDSNEFMVILKTDSVDKVEQLSHWLRLISNQEANDLGVQIADSLLRSLDDNID